MKIVFSLIITRVALAYSRLSPHGINNALSMGKASNESGATCGVGYTYCGYILQDEKRT
jgi:hypothetical protein